MKRYEKFVLEAEKGITFEVSEGTNGELIVKAQNIATTSAHSTNHVNPSIPEVSKHVKAQNIATASVYSTNYVNPPIPKGYKHICGEWNNGFVIERCSDGSQFVWIPVGSLDSNGTLDGVSFTEQFGRRNYTNVIFSQEEFHEELTTEKSYGLPFKSKSYELALQLKSVRKYGGFYISRFNISKKTFDDEIMSVKGKYPWTDVGFDVAYKAASTFEYSRDVRSHLIFGAEYDSVLEWFIESKARTLSEIATDSSSWGHHANTNSSPGDILGGCWPVGTREEWCTNNIYDFAGNVNELTQEMYGSSYHVVRGGSFLYNGSKVPVAFRDGRSNGSSASFRVALYIP